VDPTTEKAIIHFIPFQLVCVFVLWKVAFFASKTKKMHGTFLSSRGRVLTIRRLRNDTLSSSKHPAPPSITRSRFLSTTQPSSYVALVVNARRSRLRPRPWNSHQHYFSTNPSPAALQPEDTSDDYDGHQLEQDIELFTSSCLSNMLPDQLAYKAALKESSALLEQELGIDSVDDEQSEEYDTPLIDHPEPSSSSPTSRIDTSGRTAVQKSAVEILRNFDPQNPPSTSDPEELQLWLECAAQREAVTRCQNIVQKARDRKAYDSLSLMQRHIVQWFEDIRDAVEIRQKEYLSNKGQGAARKRYGPFLCSLPPEKMSVIVAHEAMTQTLLQSGKTGREGVPLIRIAHAIGSAIETEVISQRRMKERFHDTREKEDDNGESAEPKSTEKNNTAADRWKFSASHLKLFIAELQRIDPKMGKSKRSINYAMRRAKQAMNSEDGWVKEDIIHVGSALLSILIENAKLNNKGREEPVFRVEKRWTPKKKTTSYVVLNENLHKMFTEDELISWAAMTTRHTPMIVPPTEWTGLREGGYRWLEADIMRTHDSQVQREALRHGNLSLVYDGLNILGKTAWKINKEILDIGQTCWDKNIPIGDIPPRTDLEVPMEPMRPDRVSPEVYADKESEDAKVAIAANQSYRSSLYKRQRIVQKNMVSALEICSYVAVAVYMDKRD
jgi:hypothetical protein